MRASVSPSLSPLITNVTFPPVETAGDAAVFSIYLGNIPSDVILEEVRVNEVQVPMEPTEGGFSVTPIVHLNGSRAYQLQLPFSNAAVQRTVRLLAPRLSLCTDSTCGTGRDG